MSPPEYTACRGWLVLQEKKGSKGRCLRLLEGKSASADGGVAGQEQEGVVLVAVGRNARTGVLPRNGKGGPGAGGVATLQRRTGQGLGLLLLSVESRGVGLGLEGLQGKR